MVRVSAQRRVCSDSRQQVPGLRQRGIGVAAVALGPCNAWAQILCSQVQVPASAGPGCPSTYPRGLTVGGRLRLWLPFQGPQRARVSTSLLGVLGKQSFRACKGDPCCPPGPLPEPNPSATCGQRCLPTPLPWVPGLTGREQSWCKSWRPLHYSSPGSSILPQEKAHRGRSLQSPLRQPPGAQEERTQSLQNSLGVRVRYGRK